MIRKNAIKTAKTERDSKTASGGGRDSLNTLHDRHADSRSSVFVTYAATVDHTTADPQKTKTTIEIPIATTGKTGTTLVFTETAFLPTGRNRGTKNAVPGGRLTMCVRPVRLMKAHKGAMEIRQALRLSPCGRGGVPVLYFFITFLPLMMRMPLLSFDVGRPCKSYAVPLCCPASTPSMPTGTGNLNCTL